MITAGTKVVDVIDHPLFSGFGRLIFPTAFGRPDPAMTLRQVGSLLLYHHCVRAETTVDVIRALLCERAQGRPLFYHIYTEQERTQDPAKRDTGLFFFRANRVHPLQSSVPAVRSIMSPPFMKACLMRWRFPDKGITPLRWYIGRGMQMLHARIWRARSALCLPMRMNWACVRQATRSGVVLRVPEWRHIWVHTAPRPLAREIFRVQARLSCSIQDTRITQGTIRQLMPVSAAGTALRTGG